MTGISGKLPLVNQIEQTHKQLRTFGKSHPKVKSHISIIAHNLTILGSQDDPNHSDHTAMRKLTMRNIHGLERALAGASRAI